MAECAPYIPFIKTGLQLNMNTGEILYIPLPDGQCEERNGPHRCCKPIGHGFSHHDHRCWHGPDFAYVWYKDSDGKCYPDAKAAE